MRKWANFFRFVSFLILSAFLYLQPLISHAAGLDAPHNDSKLVGCTSCHDLTSSDPNHLPQLDHTPIVGDIDDNIPNNLCWSCHIDPVIPPQYKETHSSQTTDSKYGNWAVQCSVCHNQHTQEQNNAFGTNYGKFIRRIISLFRIKGLTRTGTRDVKFTAATGPNSFADGSGAVDGICEVCHTQTSAWLNDGSLVDATAHKGLKGRNCTKCHPHDLGFKAEYECLDCHDDKTNTETNGTRADVKQQFNGKSHHVQRIDGSIENTDCYQCHWEADSSGKVTDYHGATPGSAVDLVIYGAQNRPETYTFGNTALEYSADGSRSQITSLNDHCLGCHNDQNNSYEPFNDGNTPNKYAWDGSSIEARYSQTGTARWGKYYNSGGNQNANYAAEKDITKAYSAHGNATNNYGGGYSTVPSCYGSDITDQTCPDLGGTWNAANSQCDSLSLSQCTQNYCEGLTSTMGVL